MTADPDEISTHTRRGRAESGREDEKRHDLSPADVLSSHSTAERPAGTAHDTHERPKHRTRRQFRHFSPPISQPRPLLDISEMCKKRNDCKPQTALFSALFKPLTAAETEARRAAQISLMRGINPRSTEPQRSGATFTFALNPGRAVALLGKPQINSFWNYHPRTPSPPKHVNPT